MKAGTTTKNGTGAKALQDVDIEALAAEKKRERQDKCSAEVNRILAEHKCGISLFAQIGNVTVPLNHVIALPVVIQITST